MGQKTKKRILTVLATLFMVILAAVLVMFMRSVGCSYGEAFGLSGIVMILMCASRVTRMIFYGHIIKLIVEHTGDAVCRTIDLSDLRSVKGGADNAVSAGVDDGGRSAGLSENTSACQFHI